MKKIQPAFVAVILALFGMRLGTAQDQKAPMSFFVTSQGPSAIGIELGYRGSCHRVLSLTLITELFFPCSPHVPSRNADELLFALNDEAEPFVEIDILPAVGFEIAG